MVFALLVLLILATVSGAQLRARHVLAKPAVPREDLAGNDLEAAKQGISGR